MKYTHTIDGGKPWNWLQGCSADGRKEEEEEEAVVVVMVVLVVVEMEVEMDAEAICHGHVTGTSLGVV